MHEAEANCAAPISTSEARQRLTPTPGSPPTHQYQVIGHCFNPNLTYPECDLNPCTGDEGGFWHSLMESPIAADPPIWTHIGYVCLEDAAELTQEISAADVAREFQRLTWPEAELVIQPPGGETLVNLTTIFHTPDTDPVTQTVTLLGQRIEIEATPTTWTWHWAQPKDRAADTSHQAHTSTDPGGAYPNRAITHAYTLADTTVHPSLDVTYTGRYRVNNGNWEDIPGDHTVTGTPQPLTVLQAQPGLIQ